MQKENSLEGELKNVVFQNFLKHLQQNMRNKLPRDGLWNSSNISAFTSLLFNNTKPGLVRTLWAVIIMIGMFEIIIGSSILMYICCYTRDYDMMYNTENSNLISNLSFVGCVDLIITGSVLLFGLIMKRERPIRLYLFMSVILCVYIFVFACIKIHLSILAIEKNGEVIVTDTFKYKIYLSTACILGIATFLGSVIHFIATMTVLTYYNLKYIQPGL